jgi:hypothetical protein
MYITLSVLRPLQIKIAAFGCNFIDRYRCCKDLPRRLRWQEMLVSLHHITRHPITQQSSANIYNKENNQLDATIGSLLELQS